MLPPNDDAGKYENQSEFPMKTAIPGFTHLPLLAAREWQSWRRSPHEFAPLLFQN
jgi:hypothetical protein